MRSDLTQLPNRELYAPLLLFMIGPAHVPSAVTAAGYRVDESVAALTTG